MQLSNTLKTIACLFAWTLLADIAMAQNFKFQRTSSLLTANGNGYAAIDSWTDGPNPDTDTQTATLAGISTGAAVGGVSPDHVYVTVDAEATLNPDNQPTIQILATTLADGLADVGDLSTWYVEGTSHGTAHGDAEATLTQVAGSGGSVDVKCVIDVGAAVLVQSGSFFTTAQYGGFTMPGFEAYAIVNSSPILYVYSDPITADIWEYSYIEQEFYYLGNMFYIDIVQLHYESAAITLNDGDTVQLVAESRANLQGQSSFATADSATVYCTLSAALTTLP